jgi:ribosomal-protein-alanine N-acetyltransferase
MIRVASTSDLEAIDAIERASFGNPWPLDAYAQELERPGGRLEVAELHGHGVVGFSCTWYVPDRPRAGEELEAHLLRIAVDPRFRRRQVGRDLVGAVLARAAAAAVHHMTLEVASENHAAVALYRCAGFVEIGRRAAYYRAPPDDAIIMRRELLSASSGEDIWARRWPPRSSSRD